MDQRDAHERRASSERRRGAGSTRGMCRSRHTRGRCGKRQRDRCGVCCPAQHLTCALARSTVYTRVALDSCPRTRLAFAPILTFTRVRYDQERPVAVKSCRRCIRKSLRCRKLVSKSNSFCERCFASRPRCQGRGRGIVERNASTTPSARDHRGRRCRVATRRRRQGDQPTSVIAGKLGKVVRGWCKLQREDKSWDKGPSTNRSAAKWGCAAITAPISVTSIFWCRLQCEHAD